MIKIKFYLKFKQLRKTEESEEIIIIIKYQSSINQTKN